MAHQHGFVRGLDAVSESSVKEGLFGRMFRNLDAAEFPEDALYKLGETMISGEFQKKFDDGEKADNALGDADDEENIGLPAGYTYLGQFIDHDITFDPTSSLDRENDPEALHNFRTPRMDLDSIYGSGPDDQPFLYEKDGMHFHLGENISFDEKIRPDLPRNGATPSRALTGDKRNDENKIISQLHTLFLRFHNAVLDRELKVRKEELDDAIAHEDRARTSQIKSEIFSETQRQVRWHYQWIVIHDYLPRICGMALIHAIMDTPDGTPDLTYFKPKSGLGYLPVEFSGACFRFGHSMVRPSYFINKDVVPDPAKQSIGKGADGKDQLLGFNRVPIFSTMKSSGKANLANLNSFDALPPHWAIDWKFFFDGLGQTEASFLPQHSYKIDSFLVDPLKILPDHGDQIPKRQSLANLNLLRGVKLGLPSGQAIAKRMGLTPIADPILFDKERDTKKGNARKRLLADTKNGFRGKAPLWYYILREAEVQTDGVTLGDVGGKIVAEVLIGLIAHDRKSYLMMEPKWEPIGLGAHEGIFTMADLIKFTKA